MVGTWMGSLEVGGSRLRMVLHIARADDGSLSATLDSPDQGAFGISVSRVEVDGNKITLGVAVVGGEFSGTLSESGDELSGTWSQGGGRMPLELTRSDEAPAPPPRPQEPHPPFPYTATDVTFPNKAAGFELAGTLTTPEGAGPFPGVVLVTGSGPHDRDEFVFGHKPFLVLSDHLTRNGIAVLRYDDRGVGKSGGVFPTATSEDFATDALAAVSWLREQEGVAPERVGIAGHSEGGLIGPMAAVQSDEVGFVVMLAGPGLPGIDILMAQGERLHRGLGTPEAAILLNQRVQSGLAEIAAEEADPDAAAPRMKDLLERLREEVPEPMRAAASLSDDGIRQTVTQINSPWFRFFLHHDPRGSLERLSVPVLSLIGEKDFQVPADINNPEIEAAFTRGGNPDATVRVLPGLNHLFQKADTGLLAEYVEIEETMNPAVLEAVSDWINARFG